MGYIEPSTRKVNKNKKPLVETITSKKFWVMLNNKGRLVYHKDGHILIFSRKRDADSYLMDMINWNTAEDVNVKLEKLDVIITK